MRQSPDAQNVMLWARRNSRKTRPCIEVAPAIDVGAEQSAPLADPYIKIPIYYLAGTTNANQNAVYWPNKIPIHNSCPTPPNGIHSPESQSRLTRAFDARPSPDHRRRAGPRRCHSIWGMTSTSNEIFLQKRLIWIRSWVQRRILIKLFVHKAWRKIMQGRIPSTQWTLIWILIWIWISNLSLNLNVIWNSKHSSLNLNLNMDCFVCALCMGEALCKRAFHDRNRHRFEFEHELDFNVNFILNLTSNWIWI